MTLALNKHVNRKRDGEWSASSEEEKQSVALKSSLEEFKKESLQMSKALKGRSREGKEKHKSKEKNEPKN